MDREVVEPLIRPQPRAAAAAAATAGGDDRVNDAPSWFVWLLTLAAGVSGLLFGYDTGIISSTLVSISTSLSGRELTTLDKSLITSSTSLFALIASPITGSLADAFGRRIVILFASVLFAAGALVQALSSDVFVMIIGRSVVGLAVGSASFVVPLYISELSPAQFRGRLVVVNCLFITAGQVIAYLVGYAFSSTTEGWRWMVGLGALPALIQLLMLISMPETPRWLVKAARSDLARRVLRKVYGSKSPAVDQILVQIQLEVEAEESFKAPGGALTSTLASLRDLATVGPNRRALTIACLLQASQQLSGFNSLMYFSATIFALVGFRSPTLTSLCVASTNFIFTLIAFYAIDRIGRRRILLASIPFMAVGMLFASLAFNFLDLTTTATAISSGAKTWPTVLILSTMLYVAAYALSLGNVPWQQSELFPLSVRSVGSGLATATNWASNFLVGLTFLPMMDLITPSGAFAVFAGVCVLAWALIWLIYPETAGLQLEEVGGLLADGYGVHSSVERWKARRRLKSPHSIPQEETDS